VTVLRELASLLVSGLAAMALAGATKIDETKKVAFNAALGKAIWLY